MTNIFEELRKTNNLVNVDKICSISDYIYPFTNENIKELLKNFDLKDKDCLSVLGSSDQIFDLYLKGVKSITAFDENPLTKYYFELKKAGIQTLTFEEFILFFSEYTLNNEINPFLLNEKTFERISQNLKGESYIFWSKLFEQHGSCVKNIFCFQYETSDLIKNISYLDPKNYDYVKQNLNMINVDFINSDIKSLSYKLTKNFDFVYLSNILEYSYKLFPNNSLTDRQRIIYELECCKILLSEICMHLNKNGEIVFNYLYNMDYNIASSSFYNSEARDEVFPSKKFKILTFNNAKECVKAKSGCMTYVRAI